MKEDLSGEYFPLVGMKEKVRQQLVDKHFIFVSGDKNLIAAGMERNWPEEREIFNNKNTFLTWVNEEDQLRIISMQKGGDAKAVFDRFVSLLYLIEILMGLYRIDCSVGAVGECVKAECSKELMLDEKYGYIH